MKKIATIFVFLFTTGMLLICSSTSSAQITDLYSFNLPNGEASDGSLTLSGAVLYGMTNGGGTNKGGTVFSIDTNGGGYKTLWNFNYAADSNGSSPKGSLLLIAGKLYGMTYNGGTSNDGNIFSIDTDGSGYKDLWDFNFINDSNGAYPGGSLILVGNKLYGMASEGGVNGSGLIFSINTNGTGYKDVWDFNYAADSNGAIPDGDLILAGGKLYGVTSEGGINQDGNIFRIDTNGKNYKDLADFNGNDGENPDGSLLNLGKALYGMTYAGGHGFGVIFSIDTNGDNFKDFLSLTGFNIENPYGSLLLNGSLLYGMGYIGTLPNKEGGIFSIDTNGTGYSTLLSFNGTEGEEPEGNLTLSGNTFYGMTTAGGAHKEGVVFKFKDTNIRSSVNDIKVSQATSVRIYPNPNNGTFTMQINNGQLTMDNEKVQMEIYNELGEKVYSQLSIVNSSLSIKVSSQPGGVYFYRVTTENGTLAGEGKLVIQK